jgi:hypothetical protein
MAKAFPLFAVNAAGTLGDNVALIIHVRLAEMLHFSTHIEDPERVTELHNMRIAAKRLRYTMELILPYVEGPNSKALSTLLDKTKKIQEQIGEIHDRDVRGPLIAEFARMNEDKRPEVRVGLIRLAERELAERKRIYEQFVAYWREQRARYVLRLMALIGSIGLDGEPEADLRIDGVVDEPDAPEPAGATGTAEEIGNEQPTCALPQ